MPVTVRGGDILFNDGTTQNTAASISTTSVLNATAAASVGAVGTYAFLYLNQADNTTLGPGSTVAGSSLFYTGSGMSSTGGLWATSDGNPSGTWRLMGRIKGNQVFYGTYNMKSSLWLRIS